MPKAHADALVPVLLILAKILRSSSGASADHHVGNPRPPRPMKDKAVPVSDKRWNAE